MTVSSFSRLSLPGAADCPGSGTQELAGAIYLRLSKDDEGSGESSSIANQRKLLLRYAREHHFTIIREYIDDGFSGTSFVEVR